MSATSGDAQVWTAACGYDQLFPGRGVAVLLDDGSQAALFRAPDGAVYAISNIDPFFQAAVLSRGIVGDRAGRLVVQSPLKKQAFALDDGTCLDSPAFSVQSYPTRITADGVVEVGRATAAVLAA